MTDRPPIITPPVYLFGAPVPSAVTEKVAVAVKSPFAGLIGGAIVGAVAAYFVPKLIEAAIPTLDPNHGRDVTLEIEPE